MIVKPGRYTIRAIDAAIRLTSHGEKLAIGTSFADLFDKAPIIIIHRIRLPFNSLARS